MSSRGAFLHWCNIDFAPLGSHSSFPYCPTLYSRLSPRRGDRLYPYKLCIYVHISSNPRWAAQAHDNYSNNAMYSPSTIKMQKCHKDHRKCWCCNCCVLASSIRMQGLQAWGAAAATAVAARHPMYSSHLAMQNRSAYSACFNWSSCYLSFWSRVVGRRSKWQRFIVSSQKNFTAG